MKKLAMLLTQILACGMLTPASAQFTPQATAMPGSVPQGINYQGRLEDGGFPVSATKQMLFRVYDSLAGGVLLWTSPAQNVAVSLGLFNASVPVPITALVGGGARYLEVQIDGTTMSPRELLNSVPYALIAKSVEGTIDVSTAGLAINANASAAQPAIYISSLTGNVGVGTGNPATSFDVGGSAQFGSGAAKSTFTAAGGLLVPGSVGIGTASPAVKLDVAANVDGGDGISVTNVNAGANSGAMVTLSEGTGGSGFANVSYRNISATGNPFFSPDAAYFRADAPNGLALVQQNPAAALTFQTGGVSQIGGANERMRITSAGNVGVGTASPAATLHLAGGTAPALKVETANSAGSAMFVRDELTEVGIPAGIVLDLTGNSFLRTTGLQVGGGSGSPNLDSRGASPLVLNENNNQDVYISQGAFFRGLVVRGTGASSFTGKLGVGTTSPGTKLHVSSGVLTVDGTGAGVTVAGGPIITDSNGQRLQFGDTNVSLGNNSGSLQLNTLSGYNFKSGGGATTVAQLTSAARWRMVDPANANRIYEVVPSGTGWLIDSYGESNTPNNITISASNGSQTGGVNGGGSVTVTGGDAGGGGAGNVRLAPNQGNVGIGTGGATPGDRLEVAGGNVRLKAVAGAAGSVKLFSTLTSGAVACAAQCGAETVCLGAWTSAGVASTCATAAASNRCLCSGFGD